MSTVTHDDVIEILDQVYENLSNQSKWTQRAFRRNDEDGESFCVIGHVANVVGNHWEIDSEGNWVFVNTAKTQLVADILNCISDGWLTHYPQDALNLVVTYRKYDQVDADPDDMYFPNCDLYCYTTIMAMNDKNEDDDYDTYSTILNFVETARRSVRDGVFDELINVYNDQMLQAFI